MMSHNPTLDDPLPFLYNFLYKKDKLYSHLLKIPETVVYEHDFARVWYTYEGGSLYKRGMKEVNDNNAIYSVFVGGGSLTEATKNPRGFGSSSLKPSDGSAIMAGASPGVGLGSSRKWTPEDRRAQDAVVAVYITYSAERSSEQKKPSKPQGQGSPTATATTAAAAATSQGLLGKSRYGVRRMSQVSTSSGGAGNPQPPQPQSLSRRPGTAPSLPPSRPPPTSAHLHGAQAQAQTREVAEDAVTRIGRENRAQGDTQRRNRWSDVHIPPTSAAQSAMETLANGSLGDDCFEILHLTRSQLREFLLSRHKGTVCGILQKHVTGRLAFNDVIKVIWTPWACIVQRRRNTHQSNDPSHALFERTVTEKLYVNHVEEGQVAPSLAERIRQLCDKMVGDLRGMEGYHKAILTKMVLFFRFDKRFRLYFLFCPEIEWHPSRLPQISLYPTCHSLDLVSAAPPIPPSALSTTTTSGAPATAAAAAAAATATFTAMGSGGGGGIISPRLSFAGVAATVVGQLRSTSVLVTTPSPS